MSQTHESFPGGPKVTTFWSDGEARAQFIYLGEDRTFDESEMEKVFKMVERAKLAVSMSNLSGRERQIG